MKKMKALIIPSLFLVCLGAHATVPVSVSKFTDKSGSSNCRYEKFNWSWWHDYLGDGFKDILANELANSNKVELMERETINDIYQDEHELINSEDDHSLKRGKFKKAKYAFVGAVTEYEYCAKKSGANVNVGGLLSLAGVNAPNLEVGMKGAKAKVGITLRVVDTQTGRVVKSIFKEAEVNDSGFDIGTDYGGYSEEKTSPLDKAARLAIADATKDALTYIK